MFPLRVKKFERVEYTLIFFYLPRVTRKKNNNKKKIKWKKFTNNLKMFSSWKKKIGISKIKIRKIKSWNSQNRQHHVLPNSYRFSAENGRTDNTDSSAATLLPLACSSLWHLVLSKWRSMASVAGLWIWSNRDVHELRHAFRVEQGVVHQSVTTRTKMSDDIGKMGRLKLANYRVTYFVDGRAFLYVGIVFFPRQKNPNF